MPNAKPSSTTEVPDWAESADPGSVVSVPAPKRLLGWVISERPPSAYFNWLFRCYGRWIKYVDTLEQNAFTWPLKQIFTGGADMGAKLRVLSGGLEVTGPTTLTGNTAVTGTLSSTGNATVGGTLGVTGAATVASLNAGAGAISGGPVSGTTGTFSGAVSATGGTLTGVTLAGTITAGTWVGTAGSPAITLAPGWSNSVVPSDAAVQAKVLPWGVLMLRGSIQGDLSVGTSFMLTLPVGYRPSESRRAVIAYNTEQVVRIAISTTGQVNLVVVGTLPTSGIAFVHFDGVCVSM